MFFVVGPRSPGVRGKVSHPDGRPGNTENTQSARAGPHVCKKKQTLGHISLFKRIASTVLDQMRKL
jgi:hypothetical protein